MTKDQFGRSIKYCRVSLTERCNMRCVYCSPEKKLRNPREDILTIDEFCRVIRVFTRLGISHIRLTGGEPLVRQGLPRLIHEVARFPGIDDLSMTTNMLLMEDAAKTLKEAGLQRLNVSLDSLDPERFSKITGGGDLSKVLRGIDAALEAGLTPIKINMVVMKDINIGDIIPMIRFCIEKKLFMRMIEYMPVGVAQKELKEKHFPISEIKKLVAKEFTLQETTTRGPGPAKYHQIAGHGICIGFIAAISQHFCESCNRVRLTSNGMLHLCLGHENQFNLREVIRSTKDDSVLKEAILSAIQKKPLGHKFAEHDSLMMIGMAGLGG
ncbi:MAG: GTP 3',8-cyclase MoaA [Nitrospinae bacterium]|nr:GTP 3',8-cyclase MoaA [Nitrospinota bacterium]